MLRNVARWLTKPYCSLLGAWAWIILMYFAGYFHPLATWIFIPAFLGVVVINTVSQIIYRQVKKG